MEIDTLMTAAKSEVNIMLVMPLVILGIIGTAGAGFMDAIYTEPAGRAVATGGWWCSSSASSWPGNSAMWRSEEEAA